MFYLKQCFFDFIEQEKKIGYKHSPNAKSCESKAAKAFICLMEEFEALSENDHPYFMEKYPCTLTIEEIESIWSYIDEADDWSIFESKLEDIRFIFFFLAAAYKGESNA